MRSSICSIAIAATSWSIMTITYGLTDTGFRRKTYAEIIASLEAWQRDKISTKLDLSEKTVLGNVNAIVSEELAQSWETLEAAAGVLDPDTAVAALLVGVCKLTGVVRSGADYGHVADVTLTFDRACTIPANTLLLSVEGEATNLWSNDSEIIAATAGTQTADFTSVGTGSTYAAAAETLTVISTPILGLVSATNPTEATAGTDQQSLDALRTEREASLAATGKGTTAAIAAALLTVPGVLDARVFENDTDTTDDGIPPHAIRPVIWDGTGEAAEDMALAQAIYTSKGAGTETHGAIDSATTDPWGTSKIVHFDRAAVVPIYVVVVVSGTFTESTLQAAIVAAHDAVIDRDVYFALLIAAAIQCPGVTTVSDLTLGLSPAPEGRVNLVIANDEVGVLDTSRVHVVTVTE